MTTASLEYAPFRLKAGVSETDLTKASAALQTEFLAAQPGFVRRDLVKTATGYADLVLWSSHELAAAAMEKFTQNPVGARYFGLINIRGRLRGRAKGRPKLSPSWKPPIRVSFVA